MGHTAESFFLTFSDSVRVVLTSHTQHVRRTHLGSRIILGKQGAVRQIEITYLKLVLYDFELTLAVDDETAGSSVTLIRPALSAETSRQAVGTGFYQIVILGILAVRYKIIENDIC